jgi:hypothetical protein
MKTKKNLFCAALLLGYAYWAVQVGTPVFEKGQQSYYVITRQ